MSVSLPTLSTGSEFKPNTSIQLNTEMRKTDQSCFFEKGYQALKIILQEEGLSTAFFKGIGLASATGYTLLSSIWEQMGSAYSLKEMYDGGHIIGRELGDVGGWSPLAFFDFLALKYLLDANIAEANFVGIKRLCQNFMQDKIIQPEEAYEIILKRLTDLNAECLFQKCVASRILIALEIIGKPTIEHAVHDAESEWVLDAELEASYRTIESKHKNRCSLKRYFHRIYEGHKTAKDTQGIKGQITSITMGALVPLTLLAAVVSTAIGEVKLGQQVIGEEEDLPAYGHLGEWMSNMVVNATVAVTYCHNKYLLNPGDAIITENIIKEELESENVARDGRLYSRLCDIGYQELAERGSKNKENFLELKLQYKNKESIVGMVKA